jgi:hypothetical protein
MNREIVRLARTDLQSTGASTRGSEYLLSVSLSKGCPMLKITTALFAVALASSASAAGWRSMRLEANDEATFTESATALLEQLSPARRYVFRLALKDIWVQGKERAATNESEYTADEYFRQLDGLSYEEIVTLADPTGRTAKARYRAASLSGQSPSGRSPGTLGRAPLGFPNNSPSY